MKLGFVIMKRNIRVKFLVGLFGRICIIFNYIWQKNIKLFKRKSLKEAGQTSNTYIIYHKDKQYKVEADRRNKNQIKRGIIPHKNKLKLIKTSHSTNITKFSMNRIVNHR